MSANGLPRLELRHLTALALVAEHGSFSKAAAELGYTQSAVSQQIAALERALGERLVERPGGPVPVRLTDAGVLVARHAEAIANRLRALRADLDAFAGGAATRLRISAYQSVASQVLPPVLLRFLRDWPDTPVELTESGDDDALLHQIERGELDVGLVTLPTGHPALTEVALLEDPYVFVSAAGSPLGNHRAPLPLYELGDLALIGHPRHACQRRLEAALQSAGVEPNIVFRSGDNTTVQALVRAGVGQAVVPRLTVDDRDEGIVIRALDPAIPPRRIGLVVHANRYQSPPLRAFVETTRQHCGEASVPALPRQAPRLLEPVASTGS